ncbi:MAG: radical SAM family heme chaperone HemW [Deltaproteobacteria bacterium]|jgi:oxygen-independent coproporphyrinogen-3 oxidase|nr:radical SAM family heme chaperone HemW [Deltaproteobacteria bacterium]
MPAGLYVHVPFCSGKCPYCDFYSITALDLIPLWIEGLAREAALMAPLWPEPFDTLYLGGGSPSLLSDSELTALFEALSPLGVIKGSEATIEANPEDVTPEKAASWLSRGVNRISVGVQSFDVRWLHDSLNRRHTVEENYQAINAAAELGVSLSLDLIFGHAGQTPEEWAADLDKAANSWADHISAYGLTAAPSTLLGRALASGAAPKLPGEERSSELFMVTGEALAMRGFERYEVSNFARGGSVCRHNLKYWRREPYLGLGPSAHSFDGRRRWANASSVRRWAAALNRGERSLEFVEELTEQQIRLERIMLGLRLEEGLSVDLIEPSEKLTDLVENGFLTLVDSRLKPTPKGFMTADALAKLLA